MERRQGCLTGLLELFMLTALFDSLQKRFGFGRGCSCTGCLLRLRLDPARPLCRLVRVHVCRNQLAQAVLTPCSEGQRPATRPMSNGSFLGVFSHANANRTAL